MSSPPRRSSQLRLASVSMMGQLYTNNSSSLEPLDRATPPTPSDLRSIRTANVSPTDVDPAAAPTKSPTSW
ncbi:hypothetical protein T484DRAFT_1929342 [Baffinella frigidus]|nr:hypothetical protein T484DRAFT_1929342 [Cryptophyta sp. CCMP2293]